MINRLLLVLCLILGGLSGRGADYVPAGDRAPPGGTLWVGMAGVPGGIAQYMPGGANERTNLIDVTQAPYNADNTGATSATAAIQAAINAATLNDVVYLPPGTYKHTGSWTTPYNSPGITIRGAGSGQIAGGSVTTIFATGYRNHAFNFGDDPGYGNADAYGPFTASRGDREITATSSTGQPYEQGRVYQLDIIPDDPLLPLDVNTRGNYTQYLYCTNKDGNVLTFSHPVAMDVVSGKGTLRMAKTPPKRLIGFEKMKIEADTSEGGSNLPFSSIELINSDSCWVYDVYQTPIGNYGVHLSFSTRGEIRKNWLDGQYGALGGSNHAGVYLSGTTGVLVEDNIIERMGPLIEIFTKGQTYCVIGYNWMQDASETHGFLDHNPYSQYGLIEGSGSPTFKLDGYFGGAGRYLVFRNWWTADNFGAAATWGTLNRFSRDNSFVGNVVQRPGLSYNDYAASMGNPNIGNGDNIGTSSFLGQTATLSTRTNATTGILTGQSGHGITTGSTIDIYWQGTIYIAPNTYNISKIRKGVLVGTVSGDSIPFSGGAGDDLPDAPSEVYTGTTNDALRDYPVDWNTALPGPYALTGVLTGRASDTAGTITVDSGSLAQLIAHFAACAPSTQSVDLGTGIGPAQKVSLVGDQFSFTLDQLDKVLPETSTAMTMTPSQYGWQERDMDVIKTTDFYVNFYYFADGIPPVEALPGGTTLGNSMYLTEKPAFFGSLAWPPYDPTNPPASYNDAAKALIPAGWRRVYGNESYLGSTNTATVTGTTTVTGTLTLP